MQYSHLTDQVEGRTVLGAFLSTAGTSPLHTRHADQILLTINQLEPQLDEPEFARDWFEQKGVPYPVAPNFEWRQYSHLTDDALWRAITKNTNAV